MINGRGVRERKGEDDRSKVERDMAYHHCGANNGNYGVRQNLKYSAFSI